MNYTTGLTYKPVISRDIKHLLVQGALAHMFEFRTNDIMFREKKPPNYRDYDMFGNFANAFLGKATGPYSDCRISGKKHLFFSEARNMLQALPCSGIKAGFPMELFDKFSNVGVLLDPKKIDILAMQTNDTYSQVQHNKNITLNHDNIFGDEILKNANFDDAIIAKLHGRAIIPLQRTEEKHRQLQSLFKEHFWDLYSGGIVPAEEGFRDNITSAVGKSMDFPGIPMVTEILANVPPHAIKGIIIYSNHKIDRTAYDSSSHGDSGIFNLKGIMLANLLKERIKQGSGVELPVLHYHSNLKIEADPAKENSNISFTAPSIKEVKLEPGKITNVLEAVPEVRKLYEHYLGQGHVQNMVLGKGDVGIK